MSDNRVRETVSSYVTGVPLVVEVDSDGTVRFIVDLTEIDDVEEYDVDDEIIEAAQNAAARIGNWAETVVRKAQ